jgi:hypothetical protein
MLQGFLTPLARYAKTSSIATILAPPLLAPEPSQAADDDAKTWIGSWTSRTETGQ